MAATTATEALHERLRRQSDWDAVLLAGRDARGAVRIARDARGAAISALAPVSGTARGGRIPATDGSTAWSLFCAFDGALAGLAALGRPSRAPCRGRQSPGQ